jgi:hypothetical protein
MSRTRNKPAYDGVQDSAIGADEIEQCLLVQQEIWRIVTGVSRSKTLLPLAAQARRIAGLFPASGFTKENVADALVFAAVDSGVGVEVRVSPRQQPVAAPGLLSLVGKSKKARSEKKTRPTFAGVPIPATT